MFFLTPRYQKEAKHYRHALKRIINYRRDILPVKDLAHLEELLGSLKSAIQSRSREACAKAQSAIDDAVGRIAPPPKNAAWRENVEVIVVAIVVAAGVRAFILQPFRIPTGSMQPTLFGVVGTRTDMAAPNLLQRVVEFVWLGRSHIDITAEEDTTVVGLRERTMLNFFTFTDIVCKNKIYTAFSPVDPLVKTFGVRPGTTFRKGDPIARGYMDTGDQVFVDKITYHFLPPSRGDVFVFRTTGIMNIETGLWRSYIRKHRLDIAEEDLQRNAEFLKLHVGSQHYIKRLAGAPGDELRIDAPDLFINGKEAEEWVFRRVMSEKNGYEGYGNIRQFPFLNSPQATFNVPQRAFFALGDNSYHSSDSRNWGIVPQENVAGRGLFVYWPFSKRWGLIH